MLAKHILNLILNSFIAFLNILLVRKFGLCDHFLVVLIRNLSIINQPEVVKIE